MQPAPTEFSPTATSVDFPNNPSHSHHGLPDVPASASGSVPSRAEDAGLSPIPADTDAESVLSRATSRGRQPTANAGRLSRHDSSQDSSPGSRIDEYEKAHANTLPRRPSDDMIFQIVKSDKISNVFIQEFPNGI
jgi:hypothetical protein